MTARYPDATGIDVIGTHTRALIDVAGSTALDRPVTTCGDWSLGDLVWHVAEVQHFWAWIIDHRPAGPDEYTRPERPADEAVAGALQDAHRGLDRALQAATPSDRAWSWADDQTVGFTIRRQSHEALVHRVDAELAAGRPLPSVDPRLGADGVDELIVVMLSGVPDWATFTAGDHTVGLGADDTGDEWRLRFGRMTGTSPETGTAYDLDALELLDPTTPTDTTVSADALSLDLWLWGRLPNDVITVAGDPAGATWLRALVADASQ